MSESDIVIREVTTNVWTFSRPFSPSGLLPIGGRSTAIKLTSGEHAGGVWLFASTPLTEETKSTLSDLGPVKFLIAPNVVHYLYLADYTRAYPDAKVIGVDGLREKCKQKGIDITFAGVYSSDPKSTAQYGFEDEITAQYFAGHKNRDVAFVHGPSRTLVNADLIFNLPGNEQYSKSPRSAKVPLLGKLTPYTLAHRGFRWALSADTALMRRDAQALSQLDFDRIIPCHGDVIETEGKAAWNAAFPPQK